MAGDGDAVPVGSVMPSPLGPHVVVGDCRQGEGGGKGEGGAVREPSPRELRNAVRALYGRLDYLMKRKKEIDSHIHWLHEYNDAKDIAQELMGKLAVAECTTTKALYPRFGLDLDD